MSPRPKLPLCLLVIAASMNKTDRPRIDADGLLCYTEAATRRYRVGRCPDAPHVAGNFLCRYYTPGAALNASLLTPQTNCCIIRSTTRQSLMGSVFCCYATTYLQFYTDIVSISPQWKQRSQEQTPTRLWRVQVVVSTAGLCVLTLWVERTRRNDGRRSKEWFSDRLFDPRRMYIAGRSVPACGMQSPLIDVRTKPRPTSRRNYIKSIEVSGCAVPGAAMPASSRIRAQTGLERLWRREAEKSGLLRRFCARFDITCLMPVKAAQRLNFSLFFLVKLRMVNLTWFFAARMAAIGG